MHSYLSLVRVAPSLESPSVIIQDTAHAGFGAFAAVDLDSQSTLLVSARPVAHIIFRRFKREVCAHCFAYDRGQSWKIRDLRCGVVFCSVDCRTAWLEVYPILAQEAFAALEALMQLRSRKDADTLKLEKAAFGTTRTANEVEIEESWLSVETRADLIKSARMLEGTKPSKAQKRAIQEAIQLPINDTDILSFLLSGIISYTTSPALWATLLSVSPHTRPYASISELRATTDAYLQLLAILPRGLLEHTTPSIIHALAARDACNSFGIWSGTGARDGDEFLGYGVWPSASFFNHSCSPTVAKAREGPQWVFTLPGCVVNCGEELCISYLGEEGDAMPVGERRKKLANGWGFCCMCAKCCSEESTPP